MDTPEDTGNIEADETLLREVPASYARNNLVLPLKAEGGVLTGLVAGEAGEFALLEMARRLGLVSRPVAAPAGAIAEAIARLYGQMGSAESVMQEISGEDLASVATEFERPRDLLELTEEAPIIRLLNALIQQAVKEKASDIHVEPYERELDVRMRTDGVLGRVLAVPKIIQEALVGRIKIMAGLDIAEKRLPQDGRIRVIAGGRDVDIRVSVVPTSFGERAVLRLLDRSAGLIGLSELGLDASAASAVERLLQKTSGIVFVTGPTGSGKTTTLYAAIGRIKTGEKNLITVEDPVEYQLKGVGQMQVNPRIGLTFAAGLRSILRQDPDVIMIGEVRDHETADIAIHASLTGHLVLSTLHTNDAPSAITRLIDMGVEPFLIASSLSAVLAQRLVRKVCPFCKAPLEEGAARAAAMERFKAAGIGRADPVTGRGCDRCKGTGYLGRTGIFELLMVDDRIRALITARSDSNAIGREAAASGFKTLYADGLRKAAAGITTLVEVLRVSSGDYADI